MPRCLRSTAFSPAPSASSFWGAAFLAGGLVRRAPCTIAKRQKGQRGARLRRREEEEEKRERRRGTLSLLCLVGKNLSSVFFLSLSAPSSLEWKNPSLSLSLFRADALESQRDKEREREKERKRKKETRPEGGKKKHQINAPWKRLAATTSLPAPLNVILGLLQSADEAGATAAAAAAPEVVGASAPVMVDEQRVKRTRRRRESEVDASGERSFPC